MSREGDLMRRALKHVVVPALKNLGFAGRTSSFRRVDGEFLDLLSVQYCKYGGEFILEFARRDRGPMQASWGAMVPEDKLTVAYLSSRLRARLEQRGRTMGPSLRGFRYAGFSEDPQRYELLANEVAGLLVQVDAWLKTKQAGPNVHPFDAAA
jgi:hypothetical protein